MNTTETLLQYPPWEALIRMVNHHYRMTIDPRMAKLVEQETLSDNRLEVTLALKPSGSLRNLLPPTEQITVVYQLLDLGTYFGGTFTIVDRAYPDTTLTVVDQLSETFGVVFDRDDILHETIPMGLTTYTLKAHPRSLRWVGSLDISLPN